MARRRSAPREEELVCGLLAQAPARAACSPWAAAASLSARVREALGGHVTVLLDVAPEVAWERVGASPSGVVRPLARDATRFAPCTPSACAAV